MKFCKDCRHCAFSNFGYKFSICEHPENKTEVISKITGNFTFEYKWNYCDIQRLRGWLGCRIENTCGKEARWWEAK